MVLTFSPNILTLSAMTRGWCVHSIPFLPDRIF